MVSVDVGVGGTGQSRSPCRTTESDDLWRVDGAGEGRVSSFTCGVGRCASVPSRRGVKDLSVTGLGRTTGDGPRRVGREDGGSSVRSGEGPMSYQETLSFFILRILILFVGI